MGRRGGGGVGFPGSLAGPRTPGFCVMTARGLLLSLAQSLEGARGSAHISCDRVSGGRGLSAQGPPAPSSCWVPWPHPPGTLRLMWALLASPSSAYPMWSSRNRDSWARGPGPSCLFHRAALWSRLGLPKPSGPEARPGRRCPLPPAPLASDTALGAPALILLLH